MNLHIRKKWLVGIAAAALMASAIACGAKAEGATAAPSNGGTTPVNLAAAGVIGAPEQPTTISVSTDAGEARAALFAPSGDSGQAGIWVNGQSSLDVEPDLAVLMLGVESREETVAEARGDAAEAMEAVREALKAEGVAEDDINTTSFSISPQTVWVEIKDSLGTHGEPRITGYIVSNSLRVQVRDLETIGEVVDSAAEAGGNLIRINSITFTVDDASEYSVQLRQQAAADAMAKAQLYATAMGVQLGPLVYLNETSSSAPVLKAPMAEMAMAGYDSRAVTPINAGDVNLTTYIQAAFSIVAQ